jgi:hypothetical protein
MQSGVFHFQEFQKMSTAAQSAANQLNAQHSTGPKTPEGKATAALNHVKHGFAGAFRVLRWETQKEFDMLLDGLRSEHQPSTPTEAALVEHMAQSLWLIGRAARLQHETFNDEMAACNDPKQLALYLRYQATHERAFHRSLNQLLKLRAEKRKEEIGFESQERKRNDEARKQEIHKWAVSLAEAKLERQLVQNSTAAHSEPGAQRRVIAAKPAA